MNKQSGKMSFAGLIFIILIVYVLFKIDIKKAIEGPGFQKNVNYLKETVVGIKDKLFVEEKIKTAIEDLVGKDFSLNKFYDTRNINLIPLIDVENLKENVHESNTQNNDFGNHDYYQEDLGSSANTEPKL